MTWQRPDPDPLTIEPEPVRRRHMAEQPDLGMGPVYITLIALLVIITIAVAALLNATPRPAQPSPSAGTGWSVAVLPGAPWLEPEAGLGAPPRYAGTATWYCSSLATCTAGYQPGDMIAAIDRKDSEFRKGDRVTVRSQLAAGGAVTVTIVDTCACAGNRLIDLSRAAFARLANPDLGVIPVTLELARRERAPTGPPTDIDALRERSGE